MFMKRNSETYDITEGHGLSFSYLGNYVLLTATYGIQFWDWSNITNPVLLNYLRLPGIIPPGYSLSAWWAFWQAPYVYPPTSTSG